MSEKRIKILTEVEIEELYSAPKYSEQDQRFFLSLNDAELQLVKRLRDRKNKCMFVVLLGYFKSKPIPIIPKYSQVKADLKYVSNSICSGQQKPDTLIHVNYTCFVS